MTGESTTRNHPTSRPLAAWFVFFAGLAGVVARTVGIWKAHDLSWIKFFDNLHWTSGTAAAAILGGLGYRRVKWTGYTHHLQSS